MSVHRFVSLAADLLLLLWPVFFVTARQRPHLRVRNFKKSATIASKRVVRVSETLSRPLALKRHTTLTRGAEQRTTGETSEKLPSWECDDASFHEQVMSAFVVVGHNEARPRERSDRGRFLPIGKKASSYLGAFRVPLFN